jgi:hypothetical protein
LRASRTTRAAATSETHGRGELFITLERYRTDTSVRQTIVCMRSTAASAEAVARVGVAKDPLPTTLPPPPSGPAQPVLGHPRGASTSGHPDLRPGTAAVPGRRQRNRSGSSTPPRPARRRAAATRRSPAGAVGAWRARA